MQGLSNVFKEAKKLLWDGLSPQRVSRVNWKEEYICHAIEATALEKADSAKTIVLGRLGWKVGCVVHTVGSYLCDVVGVPSSEVYDNRPKVQEYRKDWLTSLEMEFKEIERLFPNGVHHIDGDRDNWDLSNLTD